MIDVMDMRIDVVISPVKRYGIAVMIPMAVEPDGTYLSVLGKKLCKLVLHELTVSLIILSISLSSGLETCSSDRIVLTGPVQKGIIEMQGDTFFMTGLGQFCYYIPLERSRVHYVIVRNGSIEYGEAVMMTRGQGYILRSRGLDCLHPLTGIE